MVAATFLWALLLAVVWLVLTVAVPIRRDLPLRVVPANVTPILHILTELQPTSLIRMKVPPVLTTLLVPSAFHRLRL
jgi:hypothetical protein